MIDLTPDRPKCRAHSSRTGEPCQHYPIRGSTVCRVHGGRAPQVMRAAAERLAQAMDEMLDPALVELRRIVSGEIDDPRPDDVRLKAINSLLDRMGFKATERKEIAGIGMFTLNISRGEGDAND